MKKRAVFLLLIGLILFSVYGQEELYRSWTYDLRADPVKYKVIVWGYEWNAGVQGILLTFAEPVKKGSFDENTFRVRAGGQGDLGILLDTETVERRVTGAYISDDRGNPLAEGVSHSRYITLALEVSVDDGGNPQNNCQALSYIISTGRNVWHPVLYQYQIDLKEGKTITIGDVTYRKFELLGINGENYAGGPANTREGRISPLTDGWIRSSYSMQDTNVSPAASRTIGLSLWEPEHLKKDGQQNPLIVWLHGGGEGSTIYDGDIALLANQVTQLTQEPVQQHFQTGGSAGAYVLSIQSPTAWMQYYTEAQAGRTLPAQTANWPVPSTQIYGGIWTQVIMEAIDHILETNPDINPNKVYVGGCSNGGYQTIACLVERPGFFAGAYPVCHGYQFTTLLTNVYGYVPIYRLANEKIWFTHSEADPVLRPISVNVNDTAPAWNEANRNIDLGMGRVISQIIQTLDENRVFFSYFQTVKGKEFPHATYNGHWSWIYSHQDRCQGVQNNDAIRAANSSVNGSAAMVPSDSALGGDAKVVINGQNVGLWAWLAAQTRGAAPVGVLQSGSSALIGY